MLYAATSEPALVEVISAWSTLAAAVATGVSAVFIAWQIGLTRKSVEATEKTLEIARQEFERGRALQLEAQRARIDEEMPRLTVTIISQSDRAWLPDQTTPDPYSAKPRPDQVDVGHRFQRRTDLDTRVEVSVWVRIANDGPRRAVLTLLSPYAGEEDSRREEASVGVGEDVDLRAHRIHTVREWLDIYERWMRGESSDVSIAEIVYIYPGDVGAIERHQILQGGSVIEPTPDEDWSVRVAGFKRMDGNRPSLNAAVQPFTRKYFASRLAAIEL